MLAPGKDGAGMIKNVKEILFGGQIYGKNPLPWEGKMIKQSLLYNTPELSNGSYTLHSGDARLIEGKFYDTYFVASKRSPMTMHGWVGSSDATITGGVIGHLKKWLFPRLEAVA